MIKGVVFDLDGTLINSLGFITRAVNNVLKKFGYPTHDEESVRSYVGEGVRTLMMRSLPPGQCDDQLIDKMTLAMKEIYRNSKIDGIYPYPGISSLLQKLTKTGVPIAVCSNKLHDLTVSHVQQIFPDITFAALRGASDQVALKPDPTTVLAILEILQLAPSEAIFVGDMKTDIRTGKNAGMVTMGVLWGFGTREELILEHPDHLIERPDELLRLWADL